MLSIYHRFVGLFNWKRGCLIDGIFSWKRGCLGNSELKNGVHGYPKTQIAEFLTKTERNEMQNYARRISLFEGYVPEKRICLYLETVLKTRPKFGTLQGGKLEKDLGNL